MYVGYAFPMILRGSTWTPKAGIHTQGQEILHSRLRGSSELALIPYPALYLVSGAQVVVPVGLSGDHCQDVQDKGGGPLPQQQEAPVLASLEPGRPEAQGLVHLAGVVQQPARMRRLSSAHVKRAADACIVMLLASLQPGRLRAQSPNGSPPAACRVYSVHPGLQLLCLPDNTPGAQSLRKLGCCQASIGLERTGQDG